MDMEDFYLTLKQPTILIAWLFLLTYNIPESLFTGIYGTIIL
jgi:hypothetical protein